MVEELSWHHPVAVAELPQGGTEFDLAPDEAIRAELARHAGVLAVPALTARFHVEPDGIGGAAVEGTLQATVRQTCVVTLDPFDNPIVEQISLRFAPSGAAERDAPGLIDLAKEAAPDSLVDGTLDLALVVTEFLTLAVDPYPRKPGAVFVPPDDDGKQPSPFAALENLKAKGSGSKS